MRVVVIPSRNEKTLFYTVKEALRYADRVVVIDSSSSKEFVKDLKKMKRVIVRRYRKLGKGNAIIYSLKILRGLKPDFVIFMDANERDPKDIAKIIRRLEMSFDFVVGCRDKMRSFSRNFFNKMGRAFYRLMTGIMLSDVFSGFFGVKWELLRRMKLNAQRFEIEINMLLEAWRLGAKIGGVKIKVPEISKSKCTKKDVIKISLFFDRWFLRNFIHLHRSRKLKKRVYFSIFPLFLAYLIQSLFLALDYFKKHKYKD